MRHTKGLIRGVLLAAVLLVVATGAGYGASSATGSQNVSIAAAQNIQVTVPATASIAATNPGSCGTTSTTINVKSNKDWNLQIQSDPIANPNGKAKSGLVELTDAFQYKGGSVAVFTSITATPADLFAGLQAKTASRDVTVDYNQCVEWLDAPGTYTITVNYTAYAP